MTGDHQTDEPIIERPDEHKQGDELYCWMPGSEDRECEGSCVAYDETYLSDQRRTSCTVLNAVRSVALSFGVQANVARKTVQARETQARQEQVDNLPDPPEVRS